ncbi:11174_t:CDS:1 [Diversispora eburnea]|uniref:11174_t:CDS:1 n=1 Tax=Diversispora eburnea TaxID=1213867 RepID=A0A9N9BIC4_9GLOM|nr:11174_t:CDS:1 [Diversispora eburnea]
MSFIFILLIFVIFTITSKSTPINDFAPINIELMKYSRSSNINFTEHPKLSALPRQNIQLDNNENLDSMYIGKIQINKQVFKMFFDTESSELWVPSPECKTKICNSLKKITGPFKDLKKQTTVTYGSGDVKMKFATVDINIAGFTAKDQTFGRAIKVFDNNRNLPFDGILGLGPESLSFEKRPTLVSTLVKQGLLKNPQFSFYLTDSNDKPSLFTIGGVDKTKFKGKIHFSPVIDKVGRWFIELGGVSINGKKTSTVGADGAVIQTSSSRISVPAANAKSFYKMIPKATEISDGVYAIPCDSKVKVSVKLSGQTWDINPKDFVLQSIPNRPNFCLGAIHGKQKLRYWIFGSVFMKNVYTVYQIGKNQSIGFAKLV